MMALDFNVPLISHLEILDNHLEKIMKEYYEVRRLLIELSRANPFIRKDQYNGENGDQGDECILRAYTH